MDLILTIITICLGSGIILGAAVLIKKKLAGSSGAELGKLQAQAVMAGTRLSDLLQTSGDLGSKAQLDNLASQASGFAADLEKQRRLLKEIEDKLDKSQKDVEGKESLQQETKSSKEDDELKLQQLLAGFQDVSSESMTLEQQLAESLTNLDALMGEVSLTDEQRAILTDLSTSLTNAGGRLRDLITDYRAVNERLQALQQQHNDLEDEYTKLVEQQLGA